MHNAVALNHTSPPKERFYYPELDAIRLLLFCGVWGYHALPREESYYAARHVPAALASLIADLIRSGMCSLDVFFILSAFLITELLLREKELRGTTDLRTFYIRRLLRIWPLYFFTIALAAFVSMFDRSQPLTLGYAGAFLLFLGNWMIIFRGPPGASMLNPLWSVSFEEQFYLLWPLILRKASKADIRRIVVALFLVASLVRLVLLLEHAGARTLWIDSFVRLDSISWGILLALVLHGRPAPRLGRKFRLALFLLGGCTWIAVGRYCGLHNSTPPVLGGMIGYPLMSLGAVAIFFSVFGASQDGIAFMKHPALIYMGKISFGLYAFHILALRCAYYLFRNYRHAFHLTLSSIAALGITFVMAAVSFRWLESPFLRLKQNRFTYVPSGPSLESSEVASSQHSQASPEPTEEGSEPGAGAAICDRTLLAEAGSNLQIIQASRNLASSSIEP